MEMHERFPDVFGNLTAQVLMYMLLLRYHAHITYYVVTTALLCT